jgi:putative ABC transport system ATP-binding protein
VIPTRQAFRRSNQPSAIDVQSVSREYRVPSGTVRALHDVSLEVRRGELIALMGPSGSGKTTLLNLIGGLDRPTSGSIRVLGYELRGMPERALTGFRARVVGVVFQDPHLLPGLTSLENVVAAQLPWRRRRELIPEATEMLVAVGLKDRLDFPPSSLSGGERQRVGIARALMGGRPLLLADEPTGDLDVGTAKEILELLGRLRSGLDLTMMMATHAPSVARTADRVIRLSGGTLRTEGQAVDPPSRSGP